MTIANLIGYVLYRLAQVARNRHAMSYLDWVDGYDSY